MQQRPIALVFRLDSGCRQYPFFSIDELQAFVGRKPYSKEMLQVIPIKDNKTLEKRVLAAADVPNYVKEAIQ